MAIDWAAVARDVDGLGPDDQERIVGTEGGRRALELLLGEQNLRDSVDYWIAQEPGCFTAEMVLAIVRSRVAMERCYEIYKTRRSLHEVNGAIFLLAHIGDSDALPWVREFLDDEDEAIRWNGLMVLDRILWCGGPLGDIDIETSRELLKKAESDPNPRVQERLPNLRKMLAEREQGR